MHLTQVTARPQNAGERTKLAVEGFAHTGVARAPFKRTPVIVVQFT